MRKIKEFTSYFSKTEIVLWSCSAFAILMSFYIFDKENYLTLTAALIGVTSLIFNAKGNPIGPLLMIMFSLMYGAISFAFAYYGEMITYLGMTMPMSAFAFMQWIKNPYKGNKSEVAIKRISKKEVVHMLMVTVVVTCIFYGILKVCNTANIIPSTLSVSTSFIAVYLTFKRSPYYAIGYAANDIVLIILWIMASVQSSSYISVVVCFAAFLLNDIYGFINWRRIEEKQNCAE